ncbi:hypothetical protein K1719_005314 [Acacia pycnantha]|nr:hypothetical protein K1719_005314 [Acacia pycnantha]
MCVSDENYEMKRIGTNCSKQDIEIHQEQVAPRSNGIPVYLAKITNTGISGSSISNIYLRCGWFSSATLVNPKVFKRLQFDDCLVKDGRPIGPGASIFFYYSNTYLYPLSVSSVVCDHP